LSAIYAKSWQKERFYAVYIYCSLRAALLAKKRESQTTGKEKKHGYDTDHYFDSRLSRRTTHLASQQELGYYPSGGIGLVLLILIILVLMGGSEG